MSFGLDAWGLLIAFYRNGAAHWWKSIQLWALWQGWGTCSVHCLIKSQSQATRKLTFFSTPEILVILIKVCVSGTKSSLINWSVSIIYQEEMLSSWHFQKKVNLILFSINRYSELNMNVFCADNTLPAIFDLISVVNHSDIQGHYVAIFLNSDGYWVKANDSKLTIAKSTEVTNEPVNSMLNSNAANISKCICARVQKTLNSAGCSHIFFNIWTNTRQVKPLIDELILAESESVKIK